MVHTNPFRAVSKSGTTTPSVSSLSQNRNKMTYRTNGEKASKNKNADGIMGIVVDRTVLRQAYKGTTRDLERIFRQIVAARQGRRVSKR